MDNDEFHPLTGSNVCQVLFDRFHESNTSSEVEAVRRITCMKELAGRINSEAAGKLHGPFNKNQHFLTK